MKTCHKLLTITVLLFSQGFAQNYGWVKVATLGSSLQTVEFVDSLHGWAADGASQIYKTTDGGITWILHGSDAGFAVKSISFSDTMNGWCVGWVATSGKIIHTTDGGMTWTLQLEKLGRNYLGTHAFSKSRDITSGQTHNTSGPDTGKVIRTTDGGKIWVDNTPFDSVGHYAKMQFLDSLNGFILNPYSLYTNTGNLRTRDGGVTWQHLSPRPQIQVMTFLDTLRGWGGYQQFMFKTTNGGESWQDQATLDQPDQLNMRDIEFVDSLKGWAFGDMFYGGIISEGIFRTRNGGFTWELESIGLTGDFDVVVDAQMFNDHSGIAVCNKGSVLRYQVVTYVPEKIPVQPKAFGLFQNYPNPFNPRTSIEYEIPIREHVILAVYDGLGKKVTTLVDDQQDAGRYRIRLDAGIYASGVYYYRLETNSYAATREMLLLK